MSRSKSGCDISTKETILPGSETGQRKRKSGLRFAALTILGVAVSAGTAFGVMHVMQIPGFRNALSQNTSVSPANAATKSPQADTLFAAHANQAGIRACGNVFPTLGAVLTAGTQYNIQSDWNASEPDKHAIRSLVGMNIKASDYVGPAAGMIFAAPMESGCEGTMLRIVPFPQPCQEVAAKLPEESSKKSDLIQTSVYDLGNNGGQLLLLPSGATACVGISILQGATR